MFDFNGVIEDNNSKLSGVERQALIVSLLTPDNLPKIFKLLYNVDIVISKNPIYLTKYYNNPTYKIINKDISILKKIVDNYDFVLKFMDDYLNITYSNNYFEIFRTGIINHGMCDSYITYNKEDFDYNTLKYILQKL
jgi:hypothetical protein